MYLPLAAERLAVGAVEPKGALTAGHETILLVEDEQSVRELTRQALELNGYQVIAAATPDDALELADDVRIDMLLTDVVMPQMRGGELARRLEARRPGLRTLFMSGYLDGESLVGSQGPAAFLPKPFSLAELADAVRQVLDA